MELLYLIGQVRLMPETTLSRAATLFLRRFLKPLIILVRWDTCLSKEEVHKALPFVFKSSQMTSNHTSLVPRSLFKPDSSLPVLRTHPNSGKSYLVAHIVQVSW